jgi:hypothetical protein
MLGHNRTSSKTKPNDHCDQATERPKEFQIVIHPSSKRVSVTWKSAGPSLAKLIVITFDDRSRSVDRVMHPPRAEFSAALRCFRIAGTYTMAARHGFEP